MKPTGTTYLASLTLVLLLAAGAGAVPISSVAGDQDFSDGATVSLTDYDSAQTGEPSPFDGFKGDDRPAPLGVDFRESWSMTFAPSVVAGGSITLGLYDHDYLSSGDVVSSFTMDGLDLTSALNAVIAANGAIPNQRYDVFSVNLGASAQSFLVDGVANFQLTLEAQAPGAFNGAGLDFARMDLDAIAPAFCTMLLLGEQDFADGVLVGLTEYNDAQAGEPAPFDGFRGDDRPPPNGVDFDETFTFSSIVPPIGLLAASIDLGLYDHDYLTDGALVVDLFEVDGIDLTSALNAQIQANGVASNQRYDVFSVDLMPHLAALTDGTASFRLRFQGQGGQPFNGVGLDFAKLSFYSTGIPEPSTLLLSGAGLAGLMGWGIRRRRRRL